MNLKDLEKPDQENATEEIVVKLTKYDKALLETTIHHWYPTKTKSEWFVMIMWTHFRRMATRLEKGFDKVDEETYKTLKELKQL